MKFFTREWSEGDLSEKDYTKAIQQYREHLHSLLGEEIPQAIRDFLLGISLHDGLISRIVVDRAKNQVLMELLVGDLQAGYFDMRLHYKEVAIGAADIQTLASCARDESTEVLYDEIHRLSPDTFEHRILFFPRGEIAVTFEGFEIQRRKRQDRSRDMGGPRYIEKPE